ncbi:SH3 domain-containing protein [Xylariales sp. AK1849]|nr:SH3 domain-containing protein [Xylariales sp. AK1849]
MADFCCSSPANKRANNQAERSRARRRTSGQRKPRAAAALLSLLSVTTPAMAQSTGGCVSLSGSTTCSAFESASVSTDSELVGLFNFLQYVSDAASFDRQLTSYVQTDYVQQKYQTLLGCGGITLTNTSELYARFTTSVICNAVIQNSVDACGLTGNAALPLCADSCAQYAESEAYIVADSDICSNPSSNSATQIRADLTNCALPDKSLSTQCIDAINNEPDNCGYGNSTVGLCSYCASGGINSTDTCCYNSKAESRCAGVVLPSITSTITFATATPTASSSSTAVPAPAASNNGLSGGAIAGIVIGSLIGIALLAFLLFMCIRLARRRRGSQKGSIFNQPSPSRTGPSTTQIPATNTVAAAPQGYEVLPGGRIARMSALEGHSGDSSSRRAGSGGGGSAGAAGAGAAAGYMAGRRRNGDNHSSSDDFGDSPTSETRAGVLRPPPMTSRRNGSLSSNSLLVGEDATSPTSAGMSSPPGVASQQSEQLPFFKDYYSQDDIHPGDRIAVLWAYQPRAQDEFALERGDMLKVVGIWDDGWATGIMMDERAEEWEARRQAQRDSGVSNTSGRGRDISPPVSGEIKAFPLVCVCLPEHWRKTIEGDGSTETGSSAHQSSHHT